MNVKKCIGPENLFEDEAAKELKDVFFFRNHKSQFK